MTSIKQVINNEMGESEQTNQQADTALLKEAGWTESGGFWTNQRRFVCNNDRGRVQVVDVGVTRMLSDAAALERMRPSAK